MEMEMVVRGGGRLRLMLSCCSVVFFFFVFFLETTSGDERPAKCSLGVDEGNCDQQILRWFFNSKTKHCETFVYSGCGGNANNFNSTMYCLHACNATSSNTHSYSLLETGDGKSKNGNEQISGRKMTKRSRDHKLRSKRSDDVMTYDPNPRASSGNNIRDSEYSPDGGLKGILSQLAKSVSRLETIVSHNSKQISKMSKRNSSKRRFASTTVPSASKTFEVNESPETSLESPFVKAKASMSSDQPTTKSRSDKIKILEDKVGEKAGSLFRNSLENDGVDLDEDEKERNLLESKIKSIIHDPSFVFSCRNISALDMSTLKEAVLEFNTEALREISSSNEDK